MKKSTLFLLAMAGMFFCACEDNAEPIKINCDSSKVNCNNECVSLSKMHWSDCNVCKKGYVDKDGDSANGCEKKDDQSAETEASKCKKGVECGDECVSLDELHWSDCNVCAEGFEDEDKDASNGCEKAVSGNNPDDKTSDDDKDKCETGVKCDDACVDLNALHWSACHVCAEGFEDEDKVASNGCEKSVSENNPDDKTSDDDKDKCENGVKCDDGCVDLNAHHWSACHVCAEGYEDNDGSAENGCEAEKVVKPENAGDCVVNEDCDGFSHVASTQCSEGKCIISACETGFADCDGNVLTGCEVNGMTDYYNCGASGACKAESELGRQCSLGEQCANGACKPVPEIVGCSDGTREGFLDLIRFNNLAACGGAWQKPGIHHNVPSCDRKSGNNGENAAGVGCNLEDLCAEGWHVCLGRGDVMTRSDYGCNGILDGVNQNEPVLFITRTSSTGSLNCDPDTVGIPLNMNDIFGCGNFGCFATGGDCDPLKLSSHNLCSALNNNCGCRKDGSGNVTCPNYSPGDACYGGGIGHSIDYFSALNGKSYSAAWNCGNRTDGLHEAEDIVKSQPDQQGGVMCCKDQCQQDADCGVGLICRYHVCVECIRKADGSYEGCPAGKTCTQQHTCR